MARLAHGWVLMTRPGLPPDLVAEYIRPAAKAVPRTMAARLPPLEIELAQRLEHEEIGSRWRENAAKLQMAIATSDVAPHDVAIDMLICLGQALWEHAALHECREWAALLHREIAEGVAGEIDEVVLALKRRLLAGRAFSARRFAEYNGSSYAFTAAEYVHALWHDVTVRTGAEHLPPDCVARRFELMRRWFPPNRGYRLYGR